MAMRHGNPFSRHLEFWIDVIRLPNSLTTTFWFHFVIDPGHFHESTIWLEEEATTRQWICPSYGWRAGSGLFFFWWTKNMLNLTGIGGPRHRHYFAWHYIIFSSCTLHGKSVITLPWRVALHCTSHRPFDLQVVRPYARTSAGASSQWPHSPSPSRISHFNATNTVIVDEV